jgi:nucleoside-diphosphate-sugar epimerase
MRVLVIGCGYVGQSLAFQLARQGHQVFGLSRSPVAAPELTAAGITLLSGDLTQPADLARLPGPFDWVVNCVSSTHGGAEDYQRVYFEGTRNLLAWLAPQPPKKFVYTSSTGVYGQDDGSLLTETAPAEPPSPTGQILRATEQLLLEAARLHGLPAVILRVAGIYGPGRGYFFKQFLSGEARMEGAGERHLNMIHRDDVVGAIIAALWQGQPGEIYHACDDEPVPQIEFFRWLAGQLGRDLPPAIAPDAALSRKRGVSNKRISNARLKTDLNYRCQYPTFREGYAAEIAAHQLQKPG